VPSELTGSVVAVTVLAAATAFGVVRRVRDGKLRPTSGTDGGAVRDGMTGDGMTDDRAVLASFGVDGASPVTLLQFSSAFCAPCRATRSLCATVAGEVEGVRHIEVDAESNLDAVRALRIMRTPTLLVVDATGRVVRRAVGQPPTRAHLLAAVNEAMKVGSNR
jgi:thiol-disulfide isomerase/thioredoxin